jgi:hypothetical protein
LVAKGGLQLFLKYKDSISTDATNRREGEINRAASEMKMTRTQYEKWYEKQKRKPNQPCGDLNISGANKRGEKKGSCSTGQSMGGDSLKDIQ